MTSPNLFLVGIQKCGSSSLFNILSKHKDIICSDPKETFALTDNTSSNFNSKINISNSEFRWDDYFENQNAKYYLEGSVNNFYQNSALEYISNLSERKVIFIVRDPIKRFISTFNYYGRKITQFKSINNLDEYFNIVSNYFDKIDNEGAKYAVEHGKYCQFIATWTKALGSENVKVVVLERLISQPEEELKSLFNFLELPVLANTVIPHQNKTKNVINTRLNYFLLKYFRGLGLRKTFIGKFYRFMNTTPKKPSINNELKEKLINIYKSEYSIYGKSFN